MVQLVDLSGGSFSSVIKIHVINQSEVITLLSDLTALKLQFIEKQRKLKVVDEYSLTEEAAKIYQKSKVYDTDIVLSESSVNICNRSYLFIPKKHR